MNVTESPESKQNVRRGFRARRRVAVVLAFMKQISSSLVLGLSLAGGVFASEPVNYLKDIKPVLAARCYACHGALKQKAGLRLDTAEAIRKGGKHGPAALPGKPEKSPLIARVTTHDADERMPQEGEPLSAPQIETLKRWVSAGAKGSANEVADQDPSRHWAFQPPVRPPVPKVKSKKWVRNPVDSFLGAEQEKRGLKPQANVEKSLLLRRVYLDLIGLPPTRTETQAFLAETAPDAYEQVVERLLKSPHYGERWGRHFMDLWRYSDWYGLDAQLRYSQKHIWHWRDWIVESLNQDQGYDQMIREMLAGDELAPADSKVVRATGFLARNYFLFNRTTWMEDVVEHTAKAFLGLTLNCAKCHDHKFDPLTQTDYYRFRAIFEPYQVRLDPVAGEPNLEVDGLPRVYDAHADAPTWLFVRGDEKRPDKSKSLPPGIPVVLARAPLNIQPVALPLETFAPSLKPGIEQDFLLGAERSLADAQAALAKAKQALAVAEAAQTNAPAPGASPAGKRPVSPSAPLVKSNFAAAEDEQWELGPGQWTFESGKLSQKQLGTRTHVRYRKAVPADFAAKFRFQIKGGAIWKSVGLAFDVAPNREVLVYVSAYTDSKLQIAYKDGGDYVYPPDAALGRPVPLDQPLELGVMVSGRVLNVAVNGEHALAFRLPIERHSGGFDLITYDAAADFLGVELSALPAEAKMIEPGTGRPLAPAKPSVEDAQTAVTLAEKTLVTAGLKPKALRAAFAADRAHYANPPAANDAELIRAAARAERQHAAAAADEALVRADQELSRLRAGGMAKDKITAAEKNATDARAAWELARKALAAPGENYISPRAARKAFEGPTETEAMLPAVFPPTSTGRRTALANWITERKNPLTARVAVNHLWARHFGEPLVPNVFDFGRKNPPPLNPALLDWLAVELMEQQWSLKHIHRLLVTSSAYRLTTSLAGADVATRKADPDNKYLWRRNPGRMEAQVVRDSVLHLAGVLDLKVGGPTVDPKRDEDSLRRSLYFTHSENDHHRLLDVFDNAKVLECYRRQESILPQQALAMSNSKLGLGMAPKIAAGLAKGGNLEEAEFIGRAFETILSRPPTAAERTECQQALAGWAKLPPGKNTDVTQRARANLVHALLNHNDFISIR